MKLMSISEVSVGDANSVSILLEMSAISSGSGDRPNTAFAIKPGRSPSGGEGFRYYMIRRTRPLVILNMLVISGVNASGTFCSRRTASSSSRLRFHREYPR